MNAVYEWIITNTAKADILVSLIGIEAMLSFRFPGKSPTGIISQGDFGDDFKYHRLKTPLSFSVPPLSPSGAAPRRGSRSIRCRGDYRDCGLLDLRAFAGLASSVKTLIEGARQFDHFWSLSGGGLYSAGSLSGGGGGLAGAIVRQALRTYPELRFHGEDIVDWSLSYFDFNAASQDASVELRGLVSRMEQAAAEEEEGGGGEGIGARGGAVDYGLDMSEEHYFQKFRNVGPDKVNLSGDKEDQRLRVCSKFAFQFFDISFSCNIW